MKARYRGTRIRRTASECYHSSPKPSVHLNRSTVSTRYTCICITLPINACIHLLINKPRPKRKYRERQCTDTL